MKITKHGDRYDDGRPFMGRCDSCDCEVEVSRNEIQYQSDQEGSYYYIKCPECGFTIYFDDKRLK